MAEATMSVIRQLSRPIDVLQIENINEEDSEFHGKKLHGLRQIQLGAFRDSYERIDNYWFFPVIKKYLAHFFAYTTAAKHIMWNITGTIKKERVAPGADLVAYHNFSNGPSTKQMV